MSKLVGRPIYKRIIDFENLYQAYRKVRLCKRHYPLQQQYEYSLETNLARLQRRLTDPRQYQPGPYRKFVVCEPKRRQVSAPAFEDRIIHQAVFRLLEPPIAATFIPNTYACLLDKGTHKAVADLHESLKQLGKTDNPYDIFYLKADIRSYFASIDHTILKKLLREKISCQKTLILLNKIINSYEDSEGKGIPIGNLTSQLFANLYLSELDHFVVKRLVGRETGSYRYFRYMDDFILLCRSKAKLHKQRGEIRRFLDTRLKLKLHPKKQLIQRASFGIDFCGYHIFANKVILRKKTLRRFVRRYKRKKKKIVRLEREAQQYLLPELREEKLAQADTLREELNRSVTSHLGFLHYSRLDLSHKDFIYVNKIRLPYLPKAVKLKSRP